MRRIVCLGATVALALAGAARADEQADLRKVIDKAVKATGGEEKIAKFKAVTFKGKGKFYGMGGDGIDYTSDTAVQQPDKLRVHIEAGAQFVYTRVFNGDKLWEKIGDDVKEIDDKDQIAEAKESMYAGRVQTLVPLKDKAFTLAALGEVKVGGKPAVGVRVSHKGHKDVSLFFDKESGLLVKRERPAKDFMADGKEFTEELLYSKHKEVKGVQYPTKLVINHDGKKFIEQEDSDIEPKEKLDADTFKKP